MQDQEPPRQNHNNTHGRISFTASAMPSPARSPSRSSSSASRSSSRSALRPAAPSRTDPHPPRPSSPAAARPASPPHQGRTPDPRPTSAAPQPTRTPASTTDGTDALPEQPAAQQQDQAQSTALANAFAERWVGTVRRDCLDWLLITSRRQLERVLRIYVDHYNSHTPHRALGLAAPTPGPRLRLVGPDPPDHLHRRDRVGGLIHEYARAA